jgi:hypothetical protein
MPGRALSRYPGLAALCPDLFWRQQHGLNGGVKLCQIAA